MLLCIPFLVTLRNLSLFTIAEKLVVLVVVVVVHTSSSITSSTVVASY